MKKFRLLDLFCGAGGAGMGYHMAGFDVVGVDSQPQPRYPFEFHQADALSFLKKHWREFDVIHASPPCQFYARITRLSGRPSDHPDLLKPTIDLLEKIGKPYVVENVMDAPLENYLMLCGTMFGLKVFRHRKFVTKPAIMLSPRSCNHYGRSSNGGLNGDQRHPDAPFITVVGSVHPIAKARAAMQIDWMNRAELVQSIPPAYTKWIGEQLLQMELKPMKPKSRIRKTYHAPKPNEEMQRHARCQFCGGKGADMETELVVSKAGLRYRVPKSHPQCKQSILSLSLSFSSRMIGEAFSAL